MGNTGNSDTYPYGLRAKGTKEQVYNRVTSVVVEEFDQFDGAKAAQHLNKLVREFKAASPEEKAAILGETKSEAAE